MAEAGLAGNDPRFGTGATARPETPLQWSAVVVAALLAVGLGALAVARPDLLHLQLRLTPLTAVAAMVAAALVAVVLARPTVALGVLVAVVYLNLSDVLIRGFDLPSLLQLILVPVLVSAWIHQGSGAVHRLLREPLTWLLTGYVLVLLASTTWAAEPALADARVVDAAKALVLYGLVVLLVDDPRRARIAGWVMVGAGALLALLGLARLAGVEPGAFEGLARIRRGQIYGSVFGGRLAGPLGDPNFFAQILLVLVPLGLYLMWEERERRARAAAAVCVALLIAGTLLTYSRGGALALIVVVVASLLSQGMRLRRIVWGGLGLLLAVTLLLPTGFRERLTTMRQFLPGNEEVVDVDSSFQERLLLTRTAWEMYAANPVLGLGAGNYQVHFGEYAERLGSAARDYEDPDAVRYPHNLYLEAGAETGSVGLAVLLAALLAAFVGLEGARAAFLGRGDPTRAALSRALAIGLGGYLISSLFLHGDFQRYLWLLLGMAAAMRALSRPGRAVAGEGHDGS